MWSVSWLLSIHKVFINPRLKSISQVTDKRSLIRNIVIGAMIFFVIAIVLVVGFLLNNYVPKLPGSSGDTSGYLFALEQEFPAKTVDFVQNGTILLTSSLDGNLRLWHESDGSLIRTIDQYQGAISEALSPDEKILATTLGSGINLWTFDDGKYLSTFRGDAPQGETIYITFSSDGSKVAAAVSSRNHRIQVWQTTDGTLLHTLKGHGSSINELAMNPAGTLLASGSSDNTVRLWQISDGVLLHTLEGHTFSVDSVVFSPNGEILASGALDKTIRLWRVSDGELLNTLGGRSHIRSLAFSPDGKILASGGSDGTLRLWRVSDGTLLRTIRHWLLFGGWIWSVAISPDGTKLATASSRGSVRVFDVQEMLK